MLKYVNNMDKNSKILLIAIGVISLLLVLIFIINYFSNRKSKRQERLRRAYKKRLEKEIEAESADIEPIKKVSVKPEPVKVEPKIEEVLPEEEIVDEYVERFEDIEPEVLDDEIIEVMNDENKSDVDRILRDIKNASKEDNMNLTEFEREQEETAIISYDELCRKAGVKKKIYRQEKIQDEIEEVTPKKETYNGKFRPSKFVSPIFGVEKEKQTIKVEDEIELEQTFLKNLKEFRNGL